VYQQAGSRVDVYNYWSDAKAAADFIYNPTQFAGNVVKSSSKSLSQ